MKKSILAASVLASALFASSLSAGTCSDGLKFGFTFYGAPDNSYVVTKNTFDKFTADFPNEKLAGATIEIDTASIDTSADLSNVDKQWPAAMAKVRDGNVKNHFFKNFDADPDKITGKITEVTDKEVKVEFKINGVTKEIPFEYTVEGDVLKAKGKLDILAFNANKAWESLRKACEKAYHHGASHNVLDVYFEVPASCK